MSRLHGNDRSRRKTEEGQGCCVASWRCQLGVPSSFHRKAGRSLLVPAFCNPLAPPALRSSWISASDGIGTCLTHCSTLDNMARLLCEQYCNLKKKAEEKANISEQQRRTRVDRAYATRATRSEKLFNEGKTAVHACPGSEEDEW